MRTLTREHVIYSFSPEEKPALEIDSGEIIEVETDDCFRSQINDERDLVTSIDFSKVNPATGPIAVKTAKPGDVLAVDILDIQVAERGFMVAIPQEGVFGDLIEQPVTLVVEIKDGYFLLGKNLRFPVKPMIGVIGVSPAVDAVPCGEIGDHGGNMDAKVIGKGARVYFRVQREGAFLALGDVHAGMGDGEAVICGVEIPARVILGVKVIKKPALVPYRPMVETKRHFITIGHGPTLDEASNLALHDMLNILMKKTMMKIHDAAFLISAVGDLKVCQIVDPQKTARVEMPKNAFGLSGNIFS